MENIFKIYKRDLKNIIGNWVALVVTMGLIILPSLYAWFNIKSSWDPYSNTSGILVAVVNKDKGSSFKGTNIDVGKELINKLKENKNIGWRFVNEEEAEKGVKYGRYYASITIEEDFSYKILSILREKQEKPNLIYSVNEKINAVAPKITQKGVTNVQNEITKNFVKTVNSIIFDIFNQFGIELEKGKPKLKELSNIIIYVDSKMPQINKDIDTLYNGTFELEKIIKKVNEELPLVQRNIENGLDISKKGKKFLIDVKEGMKNAAPHIKEDLIITKDIIISSETIIKDALNILENDKDRGKSLLIKARDNLNNVIGKINSIIEFLKSLDKESNNLIIQDVIYKLNKIKDKLITRVDTINAALNLIDKGEKLSIDILNKLNEGSNEAILILDSIINNFDEKIEPAINDVMGKLIAIADNTIKILNDANENLPKGKELLEKAYKGNIKGREELKRLKDNLPGIQSSVHSLAEKLKKLDNDEQINEIIRLLKNDAKRESEFIANPVNIKENRIFSIPNYGSAMTPFFTTLSLWVGCLILVSLLSTNVTKNKDIKEFTIFEGYMGRYLTFATIAIFQAIVVSLGDLFILGVYAASKGVFVAYSIFISIIFSMIVYTLVSVFGNVGKALAVILLVLQISASGGTFPIQVTPPFFQWINPLLPFTYAISGMREAVGGVIKEIIVFDIGILSIYFFISIIIALVLKKNLNKINKKFVEKFKESGIVEH
ncbi:YhgE/Pip family protein [Clostridium lundense]|uniref:YhgE/Pip family protein n=1 Tax=Clostridium lundense TaxID=319475 RepID=UPI0004825E32